MRLKWDHTRRLDPKSMEDLVLLSQAGVSCAGAARDEFLVDEIVHLLTQTGRTNRPLGSAHTGWVPLAIQQQEQALADSGRFAGDLGEVEMCMLDHDIVGLGIGWEERREFVRKRRRAGMPDTLPTAAQIGQNRGRVGNLIAPLPLDVKHLHAEQRSAAGSVLRERATAWLLSQAGQEWQRERQILFHDAAGGLIFEAACPQGGQQGEASPKNKMRPPQRNRRRVGARKALCRKND